MVITITNIKYASDGIDQNSFMTLCRWEQSNATALIYQTLFTPAWMSTKNGRILLPEKKNVLHLVTVPFGNFSKFLGKDLEIEKKLFRKF